MPGTGTEHSSFVAGKCLNDNNLKGFRKRTELFSFLSKGVGKKKKKPTEDGKRVKEKEKDREGECHRSYRMLKKLKRTSSSKK